MTVASIKAQGVSSDGAYTVALSDGSVFSLKTEYLPPDEGDIYALLGKELSGEEEEALRKAGACFQAEQAALRLIARAEQTKAGLTAKLERRGYPSSCVRIALTVLAGRGLLSDGRFAELWMQNRIARKKESPRSMTAALCSRGVDRKSAAAALKALLPFEEEVKLLKTYMEKNKLSMKGGGQAMVKAKLRGEGFSQEAVRALAEEEL